MLEKSQPQPYLLSTGDINCCNQLFLIVDCEIVCEVPMDCIPFILLLSYFVYNICYVKGCANMYSFFEVIFLDANADKSPASIKHFLTALQQ